MSGDIVRRNKKSESQKESDQSVKSRRNVMFNDVLDGCSVNQLAALFDLDRKTVTERVAKLDPDGHRFGFPIYKVSSVAPVLVLGYTKKTELNEVTKLMRADKQKDYWDAKLKEQKYLENRGDLWRTEKVIEVLSSIYRVIRETATVYSDEVMNESGLPSEVAQRAVQMTDGMLSEIRHRLLELKIDPADDKEEPEEDDLVELGLA